MSRFGKGPAEWNLRVQTGGRFTWSAQRACVGSSGQAESWRSYWSGAGDLRWYPVGGWAQNRWWRGQPVAWSYVTQVGGWSSCAMCATLWMCSYPHTQAFALTRMGVSRVQHPGERDLMGSCRCWSGVRLWWKAGNWPSQGYFAVEEAATMPLGWKNWLTPLFFFPPHPLDVRLVSAQMIALSVLHWRMVPFFSLNKEGLRPDQVEVPEDTVTWDCLSLRNRCPSYG